MPAVAGLVMAGVGAAGAIGSGIASAKAAGDRKKYAEYTPPEETNYNFANPNQAQDWYQKGAEAQNRQIDPYAEQQQRQLVGQLQQAAAGKGPSAAQAQLQTGRDAAIQNAMAFAGSARGPNIGAAQLGAGTAATMATQQAANQAAGLRAQEQQAAMSQLGGVLGGMRQSSLGESERKDQLEKFYISQGSSREEAQLRAKMQYEEEIGRRKNQYQTLAAEEEGQKIAGIQKGISAVGQGFSQLGSAGSSMGGGGAPKK